MTENIVLDFTRTQYLGLTHGYRTLRPWSALTTGVPAALREPVLASEIAGQFTRLQGAECSLLGRSTLHIFWDLCGMLTSKNNAILIDSGSYAIARWGAERAAGRGVLVESFSHHDPQALARHLQRLPAGRRPVIIADGLCSICGCTAPLRAYAALAKTTAGMLLIDDSQALGLLGASPTPWKPYGLGGGGSLAWSGIRDAHILVISSLAKAFGAPLAVLTGSAVQVEIFARQSETRMHCSPPSLADLCAAERALGLNNIRGDLLRARLLALVKRFRHRMQQVGVRMVGGLFPVQTLATLTGEKAVRTWRQLREAGVNALLRQDHRRQPRLSFIVTSAHSPDDIDAAASILIATIFRPTLADTNKL